MIRGILGKLVELDTIQDPLAIQPYDLMEVDQEKQAALIAKQDMLEEGIDLVI